MRAKYYTSCSNLPLWNFIRIITSGNLNYLLIKRGLFNVDLKPIWEAIFSEYLELSGSSHHVKLLSLLKEQKILATKITIVHHAISSLQTNYHEGTVGVLRSMGFKLNKKTASSDLNRVVSKTKTWVMRLNRVSAELDTLSKNESVSDSDFDAILAELSRFQGYRIDPKTVTVSEYIAITNSLKKDIDGKQRENIGINRR